MDPLASNGVVRSREIPIVIVIPARNDSDWIKHSFSVLATQTYQNFSIIYIDDCSTDNTPVKVRQYAKQYGLTRRITYLRTPQRNYQACSRFLAYHLCHDHEIICMLDGDDWLASKQVLAIINRTYQGGAMATYGSYKCYTNGTINNFIYAQGTQETFPPGVIATRSFRQHRWISQHLRTAYAGLFKRIALEDLVNSDNQFYRCCTDLAEMFPVLEMAGSRVQQINQCLYIYNTDASKRSQYSYFTRQQHKSQNAYRTQVMTRIKQQSKYPSLAWQEFTSTLNLQPTFEFNREGTSDFVVTHGPDQWKDENLATLVRLLDACQLPLLLLNGEVNQGRTIYTEGVKMGFLSKIPSDPHYIISQQTTSDGFGGNLTVMLGKRCLVVTNGVGTQLTKLFSRVFTK